jgi:hypothetical protein
MLYELIAIREFDVKDIDLTEDDEDFEIGDEFIGANIEGLRPTDPYDEEALSELVLEHINAYLIIRFGLKIKGRIFASTSGGKIAADFVFSLVEEEDFEETAYKGFRNKFFLLEYKRVP